MFIWAFCTSYRDHSPFWKKHCRAMLFAYTQPFNACFVDYYPCLPAMSTGREHGCHFGHPCWQPMPTGDAFHTREHRLSRRLSAYRRPWITARQRVSPKWHGAVNMVVRTDRNSAHCTVYPYVLSSIKKFSVDLAVTESRTPYDCAHDKGNWNEHINWMCWH